MDNDYYQPVGNSNQPSAISGQPFDDAPSTRSTSSGQAGLGTGQGKQANEQNQEESQNTSQIMNTDSPQTTRSLNPPISSAPIATAPAEENDQSSTVNPSPVTVDSVTPPTKTALEPTLDTPAPVEPQDNIQTPPTPTATPTASIEESPAPTPVSQSIETNAAPLQATYDVSEKEFNQFIAETKEKIIGDMGLKQAPKEQQDRILETVNKRIMVAVTQAIIENSTDEEAQKIRSAIESNGDVEKTVGEIVEKNPALVEKIKASVGTLYQKILEESKNITNNNEQ